MSGVFFLGPQPITLDSNDHSVHSNSTIIANSSSIYIGFGTKEITLVVNVKAAPTGTAPTLTYTLQEVDPGDDTTVFGSTVSTSAINAIGVYTATIRATRGGALKVTWSLGGTGGPTFTQVYSTLTTKATTVATGLDGASVERPILVDSTGHLDIIGTVTADIGTTNGLALDATLTGGTQETRITDGTNTASVSVANALKVDGSAVTQPVSAAVLPLPAGAATEATLATRLADATFTGRINTQGQKTMAASTPVVISSDQSTLAVSGTVTANIGTSGSLALDATLTGGTQKAIIRGGAKGGTAAVDVTSTAEGADHQAVDVQIYHGGSAVDPTAIRALTATDVVTSEQGTPAALADAWPVQVTDGTNTMPTGDAVGRAIFEKITDGINTTAVKAASTAAIATDPALVVAISPNNSVAVTGTVTATNPSVGTNNAAIPASSTQVGGSDGTNLQAARVFDADSGAGSQYILGAILRKAASGGSVEAGTSTDPLRVDPTGTTAQPVTDNGASLTVDSTQLPAALVGGRLDGNVGAWLGSTAPTVGSKTSANSVPVVIASDQGAVVVSGTVTANIGTSGSLALDATLTGGTQKAIVRGGAKGATTAADVTSTASGADHQILDVAIYDAAGNHITSFGGGTQYADGAVRGTATGTLAMVDDGTNIQSAAGDSSGRLLVVGAGTAGTPVGGVLSVQGVVGGTAVPIDSTQLPAALVSGRLDVVVGASLPAGTNNIGDVDILSVPAPLSTTGGGTEATALRVTIANDSTGLLSVDDNGSSLTVDSTQLPAALVGGRLDSNLGSWLGSTAPTVGQKVMANSVPVVLASDQSALGVSGTVTANQGTAAALAGMWPVQITDGTNTLPTGDIASRAIYERVTDGTNTSAVKASSISATAADPALAVTPRQASSATLSNVAGSASSVTLLAANTARLGATVHNDSVSTLFVKFGSVASATSFTVRMVSQAYYEVPFGYTGIITGIWSVATGSARVTELV